MIDLCGLGSFAFESAPVALVVVLEYLFPEVSPLLRVVDGVTCHESASRLGIRISLGLGR